MNNYPVFHLAQPAPKVDQEQHFDRLHASAEDPGREGNGFDGDAHQLRRPGSMHHRELRLDLNT